MKKTIPTLALSLLLYACTGTATQNEKPILTVTLEPLRYFTEAIAGQHYQVVSMVTEGNNPESYDPTPQQLINLHRSQAYLRIGYIGFEQAWMKKLKANCPHLKVFDTSRGIDLIRSQAHWHGDHLHKGGVEPHIWLSTQCATLIAENICQALCLLDPIHQEDYHNGLHALKHTIANTHTTILRLMENADSTFLIYHPALTYFARDYGLLQLSIEANGKEPTSAQLKELIETCQKTDAHVVFVQQEFDQHNARIVARQLGLDIVPINPLSYDWNQEMIRIAKALKR